MCSVKCIIPADCPLMWSHYGDQHRGLCLGYSVPQEVADDLHKISYGGSRLIEASAVAEMLDGDAGACRRVDERVLLTKAGDWGYEKEWRLFGQRGSQSSPLELKEVVFGMRCFEPVKYAVMKALESRAHSVKLYEIRQGHDSFQLHKCELDDGELAATYPRCIRFIYESFKNIRYPT